MRSHLNAIWRFAVAIKLSVFAFIVAAVLGLLSMGVSGMALYYATSLAMPSSFQSLDDASGDWVWPALISVGMFWSLAFLAAGALNLFLVERGWTAFSRRFIYALVLWLAAFVLWLLVLSANQPVLQ